MARFLAGVLACAALMIWAAVATAQDGLRVALVIGNGKYDHLPRLPNPANDAQLIATTLQSVGFQLIGDKAQTDLDRAGFERAIREFGAKLGGGTVGLFYYAGHGVQVKGGNYLIPVGANPTSTADVDFELIDAELVLKQMEAAGSKLNFLILDACRNNPFGGRGLRDTSGGLAQMKAPTGTLISYATQPGNVALDGAGGHSPYTAALADVMRRPGLRVLNAFNDVGLAVHKATGGRQQPWQSSSPIDGNFYFLDPTNSQPTVSVAPAPDGELVFWQSVTASGSAADFEEYLRRYPRGQFAGLARNRLAAQHAPVPAIAASKEIAPGDHAPAQRTLWMHNGSVVYLVANGTSREFYYHQPRPGMVEAGARVGSLLFRGKIADGNYVGTAFIFTPRCGQFPYEVAGPVLDDYRRVVVRGAAPRIGKDCQIVSHVADMLDFSLISKPN